MTSASVWNKGHRNTPVPLRSTPSSRSKLAIVLHQRVQGQELGVEADGIEIQPPDGEQGMGLYWPSFIAQIQDRSGPIQADRSKAGVTRCRPILGPM